MGCMQPSDFKRFMTENQLTARAVGKATTLSPHTVCRFLAGEYVHPGTVMVLERFRSEFRRVSVGAAG